MLKRMEGITMGKDKKVKFSVVLTKSQKVNLQKAAMVEGRSISNFTRRALEVALKAVEGMRGEK